MKFNVICITASFVETSLLNIRLIQFRRIVNVNIVQLVQSKSMHKNKKETLLSDFGKI